ncbi:hypothetical protein CKO09_11385 [Chromatium weissei]|nr:hypothetical protein [Chromatium weissei]
MLFDPKRRQFASLERLNVLKGQQISRFAYQMKSTAAPHFKVNTANQPNINAALQQRLLLNYSVTKSRSSFGIEDSERAAFERGKTWT